MEAKHAQGKILFQGSGIWALGLKIRHVFDLKQTTFVTAEHTIVGTLAYMAPEQLQGREADARSDLFAFGLVLYEMLTGRPAFAADSQASLIASVLKDSPAAPSTLIGSLAQRTKDLDAVIDGCLAKDPEDRWQSARDLKRELRRLTRTSEASAVASAVQSRGRGGS